MSRRNALDTTSWIELLILCFIFSCVCLLFLLHMMGCRVGWLFQQGRELVLAVRGQEAAVPAAYPQGPEACSWGTDLGNCLRLISVMVRWFGISTSPGLNAYVFLESIKFKFSNSLVKRSLQLCVLTCVQQTHARVHCRAVRLSLLAL